MIFFYSFFLEYLYFIVDYFYKKINAAIFIKIIKSLIGFDESIKISLFFLTTVMSKKEQAHRFSKKIGTFYFFNTKNLSIVINKGKEEQTFFL